MVTDWVRDNGLPHVLDRGRLLFDRALVAHWAAAHGLTARAGFLSPEGGTYTSGLALAPMLRLGRVWRQVSAADVMATLERVLGVLPGVSAPVRTLLGQRLRARGGMNWAPVGRGFALPHFSARVTLGREAGVVALLLLREGFSIEEGAPDGVPVTRMLFFVPPSPRAHLDTLARLSRVVAKGTLSALLDRGAADGEIFEALAAADRPGPPAGRREEGV